jgi:threonine/homoserine/homoserine lactone efflux protein
VNFGILLQGTVIGFSIAAPLGPVGILCIQRTLIKGKANGLTSGLGAASADTIYGAIAGFGLTFISNTIVAQQFWLRLLGGIFLCFLGTRTLISKPKQELNKLLGGSLKKDYISTFLFTLSNPMTILSFAAIFVGLGAAIGNYSYAILFSAGIFSGSMVWWILLVSVTGVVLRKVDSKKLKIVNVASGLIIFGFGIYLLLSLLTHNP